MTEHKVTTTDESVRGRPGTVARCTCGWFDPWGIQDGSAEESAHSHKLANDPEYQLKELELEKLWAIKLAELGCTCEPLGAGSFRYKQGCDEHDPGYSKVPAPTTANIERYRCHDCSCHVAPPCGHCENCAHADHPECESDCQECEEHDD